MTGAKPGARLALVDRRGRTRGSAARREARRRRVPQRRSPAATACAAKRVRVLSTRSAPPRTRLYRQRIPTSGYGYLTTRDGTKLAINVHLPEPAPGPYPTLVEYSGYGYANPAGGESSIAPIANLLGYAVVDVNMRGTGCSGGAFDYFEPLQGLDGYDVIETVARQPWVAHDKVGMMGVSYGGISQLFVAATRPPSLAAIAPLSVIDNTATTLYPGGILNTGFALSWAKDRVHDAKPASATGGQAWALERIRGGDRTCKANQALHPEAVDLLGKVRAQQLLRARRSPTRSRPITFVHKITCRCSSPASGPTSRPAATARRCRGASPARSRKWFTFTNGTHIDSLDPATFNRWYDFLELYVAQRQPQLAAGRSAALAPVIFSAGDGRPGRDAARRPDPGPAELRGRAGRVRGAPAGADPVRQRRRQRDAGRARTRASSARSRASRCRGRARALVVPRRRRGARRRQRRPRRAPTPSPGDRTARPPTDFTGNTAAARRPVDGDARLPLDAEPRRARRSPT